MSLPFSFYRHADKIDTQSNRIVLKNLKPLVTYELVVKAGNGNGTSQLTPPLQFITADTYYVETQNGEVYLQ